MKPSATTPRERLEGKALRLMSDERLARLAAKGDRGAFAAIFDRYHQDLFGYCTSILHNREDAADAVQATMLEALRALDGESRRISLRPWLYRIAHNESIDLLRRPRTDPPPDAEVVSVADVEGDAATRAHVRTVLNDIQELPERQRGALVMRELAGLGYAEIGDALETSPAGAKQAVYAARKALHELARGREFDCETIRIKLSEGDRRVFRGRTVRAHLRACADCRTFQAGIAARESSLASFTPAMPAAAVANSLQGALAGGGAAAGVSAAVGAPGLAAVAVAVALGAGVVGVGMEQATKADGAPPRASARATPPPPAGADRRDSARDRADRLARRRARADSGSRASAAQARERRRVRARSASRSGLDPVDDSGSGVPSGDPAGTSLSSPSTRSSSGSTGIEPFVRGGRGGNADGGDGPIRSGVDDVRGAVAGTVAQAQEALPVPAPQIPVPVRPRRP